MARLARQGKGDYKIANGLGGIECNSANALSGLNGGTNATDRCFALADFG